MYFVLREVAARRLRQVYTRSLNGGIALGTDVRRLSINLHLVELPVIPLFSHDNNNSACLVRHSR